MTVPPSTPVSFDLAAAHTRALAVRPDVRQSRVQLEQAQLARRIAQADRLPDVGPALSYLSPLTIDGAPTNIASLGVQVTWEPFDWGRKDRAIATRRLEITHAEHAVADVEQRASARSTPSTAASRTRRPACGWRGWRRRWRAKRRASRPRSTRRRRRCCRTVLQSQASMADTDNQYRQALLAFWTVGAALEHAVGEE